MIVYRTSDKIPVKMGEHTVYVSPLSHSQYAAVTSNLRYEGGKVMQDQSAMIATALRYSIKDFKTDAEVTFHDGTDFHLEFEGDMLTEETLDTLYQILGTGTMSVIGTNVTAGTITDLPIVKTERKTKQMRSKKNIA